MDSKAARKAELESKLVAIEATKTKADVKEVAIEATKTKADVKEVAIKKRTADPEARLSLSLPGYRAHSCAERVAGLHDVHLTVPRAVGGAEGWHMYAGD